MNITIKLRGEATVIMPIEGIIEDINSIEIRKRFAPVAKILNKITLDDIQDLTPAQAVIIIDALTNILKSFKSQMPNLK